MKIPEPRRGAPLPDSAWTRSTYDSPHTVQFVTGLRWDPRFDLLVTDGLPGDRIHPDRLFTTEASAREALEAYLIEQIQKSEARIRALEKAFMASKEARA